MISSIDRIGLRQVAALALVLLGGASPAHAGIVTFGQSEGYAVSADLTLTLLDTATAQASVAPVSQSQGTAPPPYNRSASLASLAVSQGTYAVGTATLLDLSTGLLESTAQSNVDGQPGPRTTSATSTINTLDADLVSTLLSDLLTINATTIRSSSSVSGDFGSLTAVGSTTLEDLTINLLGNSLSIDANAAPNTQLAVSSLLGGLTIVLNEQILSGDGISSRGIITNAVRVGFENVGLTGIGTLNGELIIGHTEARMNAVPEPSTLAMAGLGCVAVAGYGWRRRRRADPQSN